MQEERSLGDIFMDVFHNELVVGNSIHTYHPYNSAFSNSDEIRIVIEKGELITATYASKIYIEGTISPQDDTKPYELNDPLFLFDAIRYKMGDQEIDHCRTPGISSLIYGRCGYSKDDVTALSNAGWHHDGSESQICDSDKKNFTAIIPLSHVLGFAAGYKRNIINMRQEIILIRSKSDEDVYKGDTEVTINITKINWKVPHITPSDSAKLEIYENINHGNEIKIAFHIRNLFYYPTLPTHTNMVIWSILNTVQSRRPRWLFVAFQTNKRGNRSRNASTLSECNISDVTGFINHVRYPYEKRHNDFSKMRGVLAFDDYLNFQMKYLDKTAPLLDLEAFLQEPIFVLDMSKQSETGEDPMLSIKLEIESLKEFPANTIAYALLLSDAGYTYNPFTGAVNAM